MCIHLVLVAKESKFSWFFLPRRETGTSPIVCRRRTYVVGIVRKLLLTKRCWFFFSHCLARTVCRSVYRMRHWKLRSFCSCLVTHEFKPAEFHMTCCTDNILSRKRTISKKRECSSSKTVTTTYI